MKKKYIFLTTILLFCLIILFVFLSNYFMLGSNIGRPRLSLKQTLGKNDYENAKVYGDNIVFSSIHNSLRIELSETDYIDDLELTVEIISPIQYEVICGGVKISDGELVNGINKIDCNGVNTSELEVVFEIDETEEVIIKQTDINYLVSNVVNFWFWYLAIAGIIMLAYIALMVTNTFNEMLFWVLKCVGLILILYCYLSILAYGNVRIPENSGRIISISDRALQTSMTGYEITKDTYITTTNYPWFNVDFSENINCNYLNLNIDDLTHNKMKIESVISRIYFANAQMYTESYSQGFSLHEGMNIVKIRGDFVNSLRLDLARKEGTSFEISNVYISEGFLGGKINYLLSVSIVGILIMIFEMRKWRNRGLDELKGVAMKIRESTVHIFNEFSSFIKRRKGVIISTFLSAMATYGILCTYYTIYIDEERAYSQQVAEIAWINQGRFANYIIERLFFVNGVYTPYLGDFIAVILLVVSSMICSMIFERASERRDVKTSSLAIAAAIYCSVPYVCAGYMIVGIYNVQLGIGLCLANLAAYLILDRDMRKWYRYIVPVLMLTFSISIYQAFIPLFITIIVVYYLIKMFFSEKRTNFFELVKNVLPSIIVTCLSTVIYFVINWIMTNYVGGTTYYSSNFNGWKDASSIKELITNIYNNIVGIYIGSYDYVYGGKTIAIPIFMLVIMVSYKLISQKMNRMLLVFLSGCSLVAPFALSILLGGGLFAGRTTLGLLVLLAAIWFIVLEQCNKSFVIRGLAFAISSYVLFFQVQYTNQLFLSEYKRYEMDQNVAEEIISDIREVNEGIYELPVVFVGAYYYDDNDLILHYEQAGSYWGVDGGNLTRVVRFMQTEGYAIDMPTMEQIVNSKEYYDEMPSWPAKGSVKVVDNSYLIVKLSQPTENWESVYIDYYSQLLGN